MPIKGITDCDFIVPRLGKLRLGIKVERNGKTYPQKVDYFVCPPEVQAKYGEKPKALAVLLPTDNIEDWCPAYYKAYTRTRGLVCKGDGEHCVYRVTDSTTGAFPTEKTLPGNIVRQDALAGLSCQGRECPEYKAKKCTEIANVQVILPEVPGLGVYQIDTTSINTMRHLINEAETMLRTFGRIAMIPMTLTLEPEEGIAGETGKKERWYCLHLRTTVTLAQLAAEGRKSVRQFLIAPPDESEGYAPAEEEEEKPPLGTPMTPAEALALWEDKPAAVRTGSAPPMDPAFDELESPSEDTEPTPAPPNIFTAKPGTLLNPETRKLLNGYPSTSVRAAAKLLTPPVDMAGKSYEEALTDEQGRAVLAKMEEQKLKAQAAMKK